MAKAFINDENLTDIADAIRATLDESRQYLPSEMAAAIDSIPIMAQLNRKKYFQSVPAGAASGYATIEKVEGNTVKFNQLVQNGDFSDGSSYWASDGNGYGQITGVSDNILTYSLWTNNAYARIQQSLLLRSSHVYYVRMSVRPSNNTVCRITRSGIELPCNGNVWTACTDIVNITNDVNMLYLYCNRMGQLSSGDHVEYTNVQCIDLTAIFGAGNEPTTVADFEAWREQNGLPAYADYNAGELLSVKMQSVKSVGFNQWDEEWEVGSIDNITGLPNNDPNNIRSKNYCRCFGNREYYVKGSVNIRYYFYDGNFSFISGGYTSAARITTPTNAAYFKVRTTSSYGNTYNHDICINISDPSKNGTYEPYQSDSADIDITTITGVNSATNVRETIFPNGMKQADQEGTVKDTLDLRSDTATVNVGSRAYQSGDESDTDVITDGTTTYYALTTPIEYTDLQDANGNPLNPRYKVEQGGTEQVLPVNTSTPTTVAPILTTTYNKNI